MSRITRHCTPAMIVALIALVSSLTGAAIAAKLVTGKQVKNSSLTGADVKDRSLTGKDLRKASIGADRLSAAARAALRGQTGAAGAPGAPGIQGPKGDQGPAGPGSGTQTFTQPAFGHFSGFDEAADDVNDQSSQVAGVAFNGEAPGATPRLITLSGVMSNPTGDGATKAVAVTVCHRATLTMRVLGMAVQRLRASAPSPTGELTATPVGSDGTERTTAGCVRVPLTDQALQSGDMFRIQVPVNVTANSGTVGGIYRLYSTSLETQS